MYRERNAVRPQQFCDSVESFGERLEREVAAGSGAGRCRDQFRGEAVFDRDFFRPERVMGRIKGELSVLHDSIRGAE